MSQLNNSNNQQNNFRLPEQNIVIMVGRLTRDPELRRTNTGKAVCSFDIAISRRTKDTVTNEWKNADPTFVPVIVWGDQAERCGNRLKKGLPVHIEGRLQTNKWRGNDDVKRSRLEVVALRVQFLVVIRQQESPAVDVKIGDVSGGGDVNEFSEQFDDVSDDDVPF
ncbi:MAG: single-stranded DNA-binding protein [Endomicrobium sp.]|jgi:single-strand DNA-binding protein|nr:single-stranded DNA-binding protein [Endomicrobium sp.]